MSESILTSTKQNLGIGASDTSFDADILLFINGVLSTLNQLGIGPEDGFTVVNSADTWASIIGTDPKKNSVKTYVYLCVRMLFDPPQTSYLVEALDKQKRELEWRLNALREDTEWTDPDPDDTDLPVILDGGAPSEEL